MTPQKAPLKLVMKEVVLIKPSKPTPSSILSLSTLDNIPDHNSLSQTVHVYRSTIHDSEPGRLVKHADGKLRINCSADGVPFLEANASCHLSSLH
ncbi:10-deacetylbaccatin III 10-O-acetyltransferase [Spatholobus suberectus]|nr:10-deacetylbaccatin III 10-O-acetyltransferase [Spatholobus suberectus]